MHRWRLCWLTLLLWLPSVLAFAEVHQPTYAFTEYRSARWQNRAGHWLEFTLTLPRGTVLSDRNRILLDFLDFWVLTRESALTGDPQAIATSLALPLEGERADLFVSDLLRFRGGEVVIRLTGIFESMADQNALMLENEAIIRFRQFLPDQGVMPRAQELQLRDTLGIPPAVLNQQRDALSEGGADAGLAHQAMAAVDVNPDDPDASEEAGPGKAANKMAANAAAESSSTPEAVRSGPAEGRRELTLSRAAGLSGLDSRPNQLLDMNSRNLIASLLSYRSEKGELPPNLEALAEAGHLLLVLRDPVTGGIWHPMNSRQPGGLAYERGTPTTGVVLATPTNGPVRRLKVETAPLRPGVSAMGQLGEGAWTPAEQQTRRMVFQIAKLLELFHNEHGYLPGSVSQLELLGFAHVGFPNLLAGRYAMSISSPTERSPGDYFYYRTRSNEFLLVGYGADGQRIITIRQPLAQPGPVRR